MSPNITPLRKLKFIIHFRWDCIILYRVCQHYVHRWLGRQLNMKANWINRGIHFWQSRSQLKMYFFWCAKLFSYVCIMYIRVHASFCIARLMVQANIIWQDFLYFFYISSWPTFSNYKLTLYANRQLTDFTVIIWWRLGLLFKIFPSELILSINLNVL